MPTLPGRGKRGSLGAHGPRDESGNDTWGISEKKIQSYIALLTILLTLAPIQEDMGQDMLTSQYKPSYGHGIAVIPSYKPL